MSLFKKLGQALRPLKNVAKPFIRSLPGVGPVAGAILDARDALAARKARTPSVAVSPANPRAVGGAFQVGSTLSQGYSTMSLLPALGGLGSAAGRAVSRIPGGVRTIGGAAAGTVAGGVLLDQFGRPVRRKRRAKGITARELKSFTRVTGILNKYCKTPAPTRRRTSRSKSCR